MHGAAKPGTPILIVAFAFGVWCLQQMPALPGPYWVAVLLAPLISARTARSFPHPAAQLARHISLFILCLGAGFFYAAVMAQQRLTDALPAAWEGQDIQLVGVVASLPQMQERGERFLFDVESIETPQARVPQRLSIAHYFSGFGAAAPVPGAQQFHAGERWRLNVRLKCPHGSYNPHGFDFEFWALERNIRATGYLRSAIDGVRLQAMVWRPGYMVERLRERLRDHFQQVLGPARYSGVLMALAFGDEGAIRPADWQIFLRTGVNHLMSISGLHVTMVAGLAFALVSACWRRSEWLTLRLPARKAAALAGVAVAGAYALITGFAVPAQRTFYMLTVISAALWSGRSASMSQVLAWAMLAVLLLDPWAVLAPGFWLSFAAVALLGYAGSARLARPHWLREAVHTQWVVTLGLTPLLLALFGQVSLVSPLANAFAIPVISLIVTPLALLGAVIPMDAILLASHAVMSWCMVLLQACAGLPLAMWQQHAPPVWTVVVAMLGVLWLLLPRGFPMRWAGALALAPMFMLLPAAPLAGELRVAVLDVGQGLAVVLQTARHALLYDTGPRYSVDADSGNRIILPYLRGAGIARLDGLILTHDDIDHTGGGGSILQGIAIEWLASSLPPDHPLLKDVVRPLPCFAGQSWNWDGVEFDMLHPAFGSYALAAVKDNDRGCVLKVTTANGRLLLPADIERISEQQLLERSPQALAAEVLVAPHHGSKTSSSPAFVAQVAPRITVFTAGYRNRFGHPKPEVVQRYADQGSRLLQSDRDGAILFQFGEQGIDVQSWRVARRRYWQNGVAENAGAG
ncbi:ComEC family competence protein [mine drainage metagenome]|uniref:ComEC family competence protein n=1 Tax=mine drainage metagenome TaxID=410659 RepID=A0A1J5QRG1_9ZZZZ